MTTVKGKGGVKKSVKPLGRAEERALLCTLRRSLYIFRREHNRMMERFVEDDEEAW